MARKCLQCRKSIASLRASAFYCGDACRLAALTIRRRRRKRCGYCIHRFQAARRDAMYCSDACRQAARRAQRSELKRNRRPSTSNARAAATGFRRMSVSTRRMADGLICRKNHKEPI